MIINPPLTPISSSASPASSSTVLALLKGLILLGTIATGWYIFKFSLYHDQITDHQWLQQKLQSFGVWGPILFFLLGGLATAVGFPRLVLSALGGFLFGLIGGTIYALFGTLIGTIIGYYYARFMGKELIDRIFPERLKNFEAKLLERPFVTALLVRNLPVGNNTLTTLFGGLRGIRAIPFFLGSAVGYLPQTFIFALIGSGVQKSEDYRIWLSIIFYLLTIPIIVYLMRKNFTTA